MATIGGLGGLGGFDPGDLMAALGQSLLTSPRTNPLAGLPAGIAAVNKAREAELDKGAMVLALTKAGFDPATAATLARNPQAAALSISTDNAAKTRGLAEKAMGEVDSLLPPTMGAPAQRAPVGPPGLPPRVGGMGGFGGIVMAPTPAGPAPALPDGITPDEDKAIRTTIGEAAGEGPTGWKAVAGVIANRAKGSGKSLTDVVLAKNQFEPWGSRRAELEGYDPNGEKYRRVAAEVLPVLRGQEVDPTGGATHFYAPKAQAALGRRAPSWDDGTGADIGNHRFFKLGYGGSGRQSPHGIPVQDDPSVPDLGPGIPLAYRNPAAPPPPYQVAAAGGPTPAAPNAPAAAGASPIPNVDAGGFFRLKMAAQSSPDTPVTQILGPNDMRDNASMLVGPDGRPLTARAAYDKLIGTGGGGAAAGTPSAVAAGGDELPRGQVAANGGKIPVPVGDLKPIPSKPDVAPNTATMRAWARSAYSRGLKMTIAGGALGEGGKGYVEAGKAAMDLAREHLKPTEIEKTLEAAGVDPASPEGRSLLLASADKRPEIQRNADAAFPGQPGRVREAIRNSLPDNRPDIVKTGQAAQDTPGLVSSGLDVEARRERDKAAASAMGAASAKSAEAAPAALDKANQALATIGKLRDHPGRWWNTGLPGSTWAIPGTKGADFVNLFDQAKAQAFLQAFETLKGAGAVTEIEGAKATAALNRLDRGLSTEGFNEALRDYEAVIRSGITRLQRAGGQAPAPGSPAGGGMGSPLSTPFGTIRQVR